MEGERANRRRIRDNNAQKTTEQRFGDEGRPLAESNAKKGYRRWYRKIGPQNANEIGSDEKQQTSDGNANQIRRMNKKFDTQKKKEVGAGGEEKRPFADSNTGNENTKKKRSQRRRKNQSDKNDGDREIKPKMEVNTEKENKPWGQRRNPRPVRNHQHKQQVPAMNLVSTTKPNIPLLHFQPPPYTILPPRVCDKTKMTVLKLKQVDAGVDESLLFWAFKHYGWIENVYVVRSSFTNRQTGVAFVGFSSDADAARAVAKSGEVQLFGRRIFVQLYADRRPKQKLRDLPPPLLTQIFARLDWRSRIRCESVCWKLRTVLTDMYELPMVVPTDAIMPKHDWLGFPEKATFVFTGNDDDSDEVKVAGGELFKVRIGNGTDFNQVLRKILLKFFDKVVSLQINGLSLNAEAVRVLQYVDVNLSQRPSFASRWKPERVLLKSCTLKEVGMGDFWNFMKHYGDRLAIE